MNRYTLALLAASVPLLGADAPLPSVQTVMDHWIAATGGRAAWEARHNLVEHATLDFAKQGLKGISHHLRSPAQPLPGDYGAGWHRQDRVRKQWRGGLGEHGAAGSAHQAGRRKG